ncbi:MAG: exo-alpha-sialidase [Candidatus Latescibacteria bacterium]|nr:exo-alpha-sialidase [Candidatus Latescibacterota bacterium]
MRNDISIRTYHEVTTLDGDLAAKMQDMMMRVSVRPAGYEVLSDWHPSNPPGWGEFPEVPVEIGSIYRGNAETWAYSHHHTIVQFKGMYVASWSNGFLHEDYVGQEVHFAASEDGLHWSPPKVVVATPVASNKVRNNAGLYADEDRLCCYVGVAEDFGRDVADPGMSTLKDPYMALDVYETSDLATWTEHEKICDNIYLFEGPRRTAGNKLMVCGFDYTGDHHAIVLIWDDPTDPCAKPRPVHLPLSPEGVLPEQGTWYQTDEGRIYMWQRDGSLSCKLGISWSDDEGDTWSEMYRTDFPNTYSRAFAGRLTDGRYFLVGNNYTNFLDRNSLLVALSDDGLTFDRQYTLRTGRTTRRIEGRHKEDGYHYPNCLVDGDKLLVIHSVNKEDIEVCIADMSKVD